MADTEMTQLRPGIYTLPVALNLADGIELTEPLTVNIVIAEEETPENGRE
jgi:hypothetical protein